MNTSISNVSLSLSVYKIRRGIENIIPAYARITYILSLPSSSFKFDYRFHDLDSRALNRRSLMHYERAAANLSHFASLRLAEASRREAFEGKMKCVVTAAETVRILEKLSLPSSSFKFDYRRFDYRSHDFTSRSLNRESLMHCQRAAANFRYFESLHLELAEALGREAFEGKMKCAVIAADIVRILETIVSDLKEAERLL